MAGETTITIEGNLTADPELRFTPQGAAVASFTIATTPRSYNKQSQSWEEGETLFMRCSAWRGLAENIAESLTKGMAVIAVGNLKQRSYEKDGQKRTVVEMDVQNVGPALRFASAAVTRNERSGGGGGAAQSSAPSGVTQSSSSAPSQWDTPSTGGSSFADEPPF